MNGWMDGWIISHSFLSLSDNKNEFFEFVRGSMQKWDVILILILILIFSRILIPILASTQCSRFRATRPYDFDPFLNITVRLYESINLFPYLLISLLIYSFTYLLILFINLFIYKHFISYYPFDYEFNRYHYIMLLHQNICTKYDLHI